MIQSSFYPGEWCDCDWSPADGAFVFVALEQPGTLRVYHHVQHPVPPALGFYRYDLGRWGLYLRAAADGQGNVCVVAQDGRDRNPATGQFYPAIVVLFPRDGQPREIACPAGPAFGQNAVEVERATTGGWFVYVATSPTTYWDAMLTPDGQWHMEETHWWAASSQGFADGPVRMDDARTSVPGMVCPSTADGLSIGQAGEPDRIRGLHQGVYFTVLAGAGFEPHLASDGQGRWMACARTPQGAALVALAAPFEAEQAQPEPPDATDFDVVPDGTLVTGAIETLVGANPQQDANGIICLHKNTFPECEWRRAQHIWWDEDGPHPGLHLRHWADASRFPGDRGWWIEPAPVWCLNRFESGRAVRTEDATLVDFHHGTRVRWRQTNTLYGLKGGGVLVQFDPRFPGQYTDMAKQGTPQWAPAGYEKQWTLNDGRAKWQYIVTPLTAKGVIPWGDPSMDVVIQETESGPGAPSDRPFVPCPRPLVSPPPPPDPPKEPAVNPTVNQIPRDQIVMAAAAIDDYLVANPRLGLPDGLLPAYDPDTTSLALALDATIAYLIGEWCPEVCRLGPFPGDAAGWTQRREAGLHHTFRVIERERGEQPGPGQPPPTGTLRGPIGVSGRDFEAPQ